ncbi:MAG: glycosyltransferase, partial [Verrucomicrobiota bacterium]
ENNLNSATAFHATGEKEARSIEAFGFRKPIYIIPNGVNCHPLTERSVEKNPFVLYLSRIHPKKGIDILLQSWNSISTQFPDWKLIIAGPSEAGYLEKLWEDFPEVRRSNRVIWKKPVYGKEKEELLQAAELVVLPTHSENFGQVVAESLAASTPVITTDQTPWQNLVMKQCGWSIPVSRDALTAALREAMSMTFEQRNEMGREGRQWMISEYSWESRARAMRDVYSFLLSQGSEPESRFL